MRCSGTSVDCSAALGAGPGPADEQRPLVLDPAVSMVSVDFAGPNRSLAGFITIMCGFMFSVHTGHARKLGGSRFLTAFLFEFEFS
jgi:hypothetical protein